MTIFDAYIAATIIFNEERRIFGRYGGAIFRDMLACHTAKLCENRRSDGEISYASPFMR